MVMIITSLIFLQITSTITVQEHIQYHLLRFFSKKEYLILFLDTKQAKYLLPLYHEVTFIYSHVIMYFVLRIQMYKQEYYQYIQFQIRAQEIKNS